jgi:hypothetical protein
MRTFPGVRIQCFVRKRTTERKGEQSPRFAVKIPKAGRYEIRLAWTPNANRATNVPVTIQHHGGSTMVKINQRKQPNHGAFGTIGTFDFKAGETTVEITNANTDGHVILDAVQLIESVQ